MAFKRKNMKIKFDKLKYYSRRQFFSAESNMHVFKAVSKAAISLNFTAASNNIWIPIFNSCSCFDDIRLAFRSKYEN